MKHIELHAIPCLQSCVQILRCNILTSVIKITNGGYSQNITDLSYSILCCDFFTLLEVEILGNCYIYIQSTPTSNMRSGKPLTLWESNTTMLVKEVSQRYFIWKKNLCHW